MVGEAGLQSMVGSEYGFRNVINSKGLNLYRRCYEKSSACQQKYHSYMNQSFDYESANHRSIWIVLRFPKHFWSVENIETKALEF